MGTLDGWRNLSRHEAFAHVEDSVQTVRNRGATHADRRH